MSQNSDLSLECIAIGSLPQDNLEEAMEIVKRDFDKIPFWPQLTKISDKEDMIIQFSDNMSSFYSVSFCNFLELVKILKPKFAKGQITGPCTMAKELGERFSIESLAEKAIAQIKK